MKKENAITLIALVVTIIVLLILAGVTINLTLGQNGIFKTAEQAAKNYTDAQEKELADLGNFDNTVAGIIKDVTRDNKLSTKAKPGDYVKYTPTAKTFSMTPEQTGQDANQDFNTGDYTGLWQVLYNDAEHGLQIISADTVGNLTLGNDTDEAKAKLAYNNAVDTLNNFCFNYVDTKYAISGRSVGSDPTSPADTTADTVTLKFEYNGSTESGCKVADTKYETDYNKMKVATNQNASGIHNLGKVYWLASRFVYSDSNGAWFCVRLGDENGYAGGANFDMWGVNSSSNVIYGAFSREVRPVVTLKSDIQIGNGDGSETSPFELVTK